MAKSKGFGLAQSGGRNRTFGGGKGGTPLTQGTSAGKSEGATHLGNGTSATIRAAAGDASPRKLKGRAGAPPPVNPPGNPVTFNKPHALPPVLRGSQQGKTAKYR